MLHSKKQYRRIEKKTTKNLKKNLDWYKNLTMKNTDNYFVKNKSKFLRDKDNNSELSTFFENLWNINLKERKKKKTAQDNLSLKQR